MNRKRTRIDLLKKVWMDRWALGLAICALFILPVVFTHVPPKIVSRIHRNNEAVPSRSHLNVLMAGAGGSQIFGNQTKAVPDSARLTQKLIPVIQKSFDRYPSYYLFIFLGGFVLFALIRILDPSYLNSIFEATVNANLLLNLFKEGIFGFNITGLLLDLVCVGMAGIFVQVFFFDLSPHLFLWILGFAAMFYVLKLILIQFLANVFMDKLEAMLHLLMHLLFTRMIGLVMLPFLFFALYQPVFDVHVLLRDALVGILILYLVWLARLFVKMKTMTKVNFFYLFLYLCTIELSTLAILLRNYIQ